MSRQVRLSDSDLFFCSKIQNLNENRLIYRQQPFNRCVITNGMMIPRFSTPEEYQRLFALNVTQYGQMTAGSWVYIGPQVRCRLHYELYDPLYRYNH